jgi:tRNA (guanine-N7-)-methyltransferase
MFYLLNPKKFNDFPVTIENIFNSKKRNLTVEIGFGGGEYLAELSNNNKDNYFIGIETSITSCLRTEKKLSKYSLKNVKIINDDAKFVIRELFDEESIKKIIVNFPCPWPKKRHENKRIFDDSFINTLNNVLEINGEIELATDVEWYSLEVKEQFEKNENFEIVKYEKNFDRTPKTRYEMKWEEMGRDKYLLIIRKKKHLKIKRILEEKSEMPHSKIQEINEENIFSLKNKKISENEKIIVIKNVFKSEDSYLIKTYTSEEEYDQEFFLVLYKKDNYWLLKLDEITNPYRTPAVKLSVEKISEYISR